MSKRWLILLIVVGVVLIIIGSCFACCRGAEFHRYGPEPDQDSGTLVILDGSGCAGEGDVGSL